MWQCERTLTESATEESLGARRSNRENVLENGQDCEKRKLQFSSFSRFGRIFCLGGLGSRCRSLPSPPDASHLTQPLCAFNSGGTAP